MNRARYLISAQTSLLFRAWRYQSTLGQSRNFKSFTNIGESSLVSCKQRPEELNNSFKALLCAQQNRTFSSTEAASIVSQLDYESFCTETLDHLTDYVEELVESTSRLEKADVLNKDGVLTITLGSTYGTYVINKQTPNKQIWLSSPTSGPKRFDFVYAANDNKNGYWIYRHTGETLHDLLDTEFSAILNNQTKFNELPFGSKC